MWMCHIWEVSPRTVSITSLNCHIQVLQYCRGHGDASYLFRGRSLAGSWHRVVLCGEMGRDGRGGGSGAGIMRMLSWRRHLGPSPRLIRFHLPGRKKKNEGERKNINSSSAPPRAAPPTLSVCRAAAAVWLGLTCVRCQISLRCLKCSDIVLMASRAHSSSFVTEGKSVFSSPPFSEKQTPFCSLDKTDAAVAAPV